MAPRIALLLRLSACRLSRIALLLLAVVAPGACDYTPQTTASLSDPGATAYDERLIGFWETHVRKGSHPTGLGAFYMQITPREEGVLALALMAAGGDFENGPRWFGARAHASTLDGQVYYNVRLISGNLDYYCTQGDCVELIASEEGQETEGQEREPRFVILRVELDGENRLYLHFMDPYVVKDQIDVGRVKAWRELDCGDFCLFHLLELSRDELIALIRTVGPDTLFHSVGAGPFYRVGEGMDWFKEDEFFDNWLRIPMQKRDAEKRSAE